MKSLLEGFPIHPQVFTQTRQPLHSKTPPYCPKISICCVLMATVLPLNNQPFPHFHFKECYLPSQVHEHPIIKQNVSTEKRYYIGQQLLEKKESSCSTSQTPWRWFMVWIPHVPATRDLREAGCFLQVVFPATTAPLLPPFAVSIILNIHQKIHPKRNRRCCTSTNSWKKLIEALRDLVFNPRDLHSYALVSRSSKEQKPCRGWDESSGKLPGCRKRGEIQGEGMLWRESYGNVAANSHVSTEAVLRCWS